MHNKPIHIFMLGLRGFPGVPGGVETHAQSLCPLLVDMGCDIEAIVRSPYVPGNLGSTWHGVKYHRLWSPKTKFLEAFIHTFLGVLYAMIRRPDILHIQAIGPAIMTPLARIGGLKVVVTHHGPDYDRQKWGKFAKFILRLGERYGMIYANQRITVSSVIHDLVKSKYNVESVVIGNAVEMPDLATSQAVLDKYNLEKGKYILLVSRLVPEKRHLDLIHAYAKLQRNDWKLVIVGATDFPDTYEKHVLEAVVQTDGVISTGYLTGKPLQELYTHAGLFVLPSSHEGHPIVLLEAMSYGLPVVVSGIPAHLEHGLEAHQYFTLGDIDELAERIKYHIDNADKYDREQLRKIIAKNYSWKHAAQRTFDVYQKVYYN